jgi:hypothetical protein
MDRIDSRNFALKEPYRALVIEELGKEILRTEMSEQSRQPKDKNYNLITVLYRPPATSSRSRPTSRTPSKRATRSWWSSLTASWRTT